MPTLAHLRGSIAGAAILTLFGCVWYILALASWTARPSWSILAGSVATIALLGLCGLRLMAIRDIQASMIRLRLPRENVLASSLALSLGPKAG